MKSSVRFAAALPLLFLCGSACTTVLPDVAPFSGATIHLRASVCAAGEAVVDELERAEVRRERVRQLEKAWARRNEIMTAMAVYADSLTAIVASGRSDAEAAEAAVEAFANLATSVGHPFGSAVELASELAQTIARQVALARARSDLAAALQEMQPAVEKLVDLLEEDLRNLDTLLLGAGRERERSFLDRADFKGLDAERQRLLGFLRSIDPDLASAEDLQKAANVAVMLQASDPLAVRRDIGLSEIRDRVRAVRQLLAETRICLRYWAITHQNLVAAVRDGTTVDVDVIIGAAQQINSLVGKLRDA